MDAKILHSEFSDICPLIPISYWKIWLPWSSANLYISNLNHKAIVLCTIAQWVGATTLHLPTVIVYIFMCSLSYIHLGLTASSELLSQLVFACQLSHLLGCDGCDIGPLIYHWAMKGERSPKIMKNVSFNMMIFGDKLWSIMISKFQLREVRPILRCIVATLSRQGVDNSSTNCKMHIEVFYVLTFYINDHYQWYKTIGSSFKIIETLMQMSPLSKL